MPVMRARGGALGGFGEHHARRDPTRWSPGAGNAGRWPGLVDRTCWAETVSAARLGVAAQRGRATADVLRGSVRSCTGRAQRTVAIEVIAKWRRGEPGSVWARVGDRKTRLDGLTTNNSLAWRRRSACPLTALQSLKRRDSLLRGEFFDEHKLQLQGRDDDGTTRQRDTKISLALQLLTLNC
jgi:hypothetical protein